MRNKMKKAILFVLLLAMNVEATQDFKLTFEQKYKSKISNRDKVSKGTLIYSYPKKIFIEIEKPDPVTFVSNGTKSWYYRPPFMESEPGEVIVNQGGESLNLLATFFDSLQKGFEKNEVFEVKKIDKIVELSFRSDYRKKVKVKNATLVFSDKSYDMSKIQKMTLIYENDEKGEFSIAKYETFSVDKKTFEFVIPANTKVSH